MPRTDRQIAEYMAYYNATPDRKTALETLAAVENKSVAEILAICAKYKEKGTTLRGTRIPLPDDIRDIIKDELLAGESYKTIEQRHGISHSTVQRIRVEMIKSGELSDLPPVRPKKTETAAKEPKGEVPERVPEAYPGQIYDDEEDSDDTKAYIPVKNDFAGECKKELNWLKMIDKLEIVAAGLFGTEAKITEIHASGIAKRAGLSIEKAGKRYDIVIEEV